MSEFREGSLDKYPRNNFKEDMSAVVGRKGGKPQVEIYRPGSGPLRKSAFGEEEFYGEGYQGRNERTNVSKERRDYQNERRNDSKNFVDDFDRLSICSNNSRKGGRSTSLTGSMGSLSDTKRRTKKPEVPIYVPPKPNSALLNNLENKTFKTRNYSNSKRTDFFKRDDSFRGEEEKDNSQWSDNRSLTGESETPKSIQEPKRLNERDKNRKIKKTRKRGVRQESKDEISNQTNGVREKIPPLMDIKFDCNPMTKTNNSCDITGGYETSGYTTTDGENEREPLCVTRNTNSLQHRNMRQASEPRSLTLSSIHLEKRGRDSRSVEPGDENQWYQDRSNQKPPSGQYGRRGNKQSHSKHKQYHLSFELLPPRLQKKYMEEKGLQEPPVHSAYSNNEKTLGSNPDLTYGGTDLEPSFNGSSPLTPYMIQTTNPSYVGMNTTYIGTNSEDAWDGGSLTFQGNNQAFYSSVPPPTMFNHPPPPMVPTQAPPHMWSQTLPQVRGRGRGRIPHHELERERIAFEEARMTRSLTPGAVNELERLEEPSNTSDEPVHLGKESESSQSVNTFDAVRSPNKEEKSPEQTRTGGLDGSLNDNANSSKLKSPVQPKSPQDLTFKKPSGTGMNWADEVELSEQLQGTLEEKDSEDNTWSITTSDILASSQPITSTSTTAAVTPHKDRRRRRKRSHSRERFNTNENRRGSVDDVICRESRSRKNSGGDRNSVSRSRKNSGDDRQWPRSRKNSTDDRNWRSENREPFDNFRPSRSDNKFSSSRNSSRNNSRNNSRSNSRNNSVERWTQDEYLNFNGSERKFRGNSGERFRKNSVKSYTNPGRRRGSRDISPERMKESKQEENWREEARRLNGPGPVGENKRQEQRKSGAGILVLPSSTSPTKETESTKSGRNNQVMHTQKLLFDPSNPHRPLIVNTPVDSSRNSGQYGAHTSQPQMISPDGQFVMPMSHPMPVLRNPNLLKEAEIIEYELNHLMMSNSWYEYHDDIIKRRSKLQEILWILLTSDIKFCEQENLEQYFWKILYYNVLEWLRKQMTSVPHNKEAVMTPMLNIIDEGVKYLERTLGVLEDCYRFKLEEFLVTGFSPAKGKPHLTMALRSAQKILLFLGDLARYKEQVQDTANYGQARQWYMKAQQLNPKNGRPYNQLALLAVYARRKLDAVYYYMRSLVATVPVTSSKESLLTLFDENRKKFEQSERQRHEEREAREREKMKEKECDRSNRSHQLRREIWIHPEGGRRVHRTTSASAAHTDTDSEAELGALPHLELNKRFGMSFIHVHGKLFTKIGMESFQSAGLQMLRQLRALLQHSPLPLTSTRLLQLLALNMFAIENTQLKNSELGPGYRSALQESALIVSLQMFGIVLERAVQLLRDQQNNSYRLIVSDDVQILLPAIKVWCDWLLCHSSVWNPPPSCHDYRVGPTGDVWARLATLVNLLERLDSQQIHLSEQCQPGYVQVRLAEDAALAGFIPLMFNCPAPMYTSQENNMEVAQVSLRIHRILFCGTVFLCGVDPPVLKLHKNETGSSEYISVVETPSPPTQSDGELCVESVSGGDSQDSGQASEDEAEGSPSHSSSNATGEIQSLLQRKQELERSHRQQEKRRQKVQSILQSSLVSVEIEVRPHYLVADTNCFIDYLPQLQTIVKASSPSQPHIYTLMVPLVVLNELDGLAHGRRDAGARPQHRAMVTESAALALEFLRSKTSPGVRCVTTRGTVLNSAAFTSEEDCQDMTNDDKILTTCLKLCHSSNKEEHVEGQPRKIWRDVVLLTEDRNLRVKALARDMPVREVLDFLQWAGLELG